MTHYQQILLRKDVSDSLKDVLKQEHERLNQLLLKRETDQRLKRVFAIQKQHGAPTSLTVLQ